MAKKPLIKTPTDVPHQAKPFQEETHAEKRAWIDQHLLKQTFEAAWHTGNDGIEDAEARIKSGLALVEGIKPTDDIESMLATQMAAAHNAAMECQRRAAQPGQPMEAFDLYMNNAAKLMLIYTRQMDALGKHRGKGHQKITVEHKNVDDGRQAVMGHAETAVALPEPSDQSETTPNHITPSAGKVIEMAGRTSAKRRSKCVGPGTKRLSATQRRCSPACGAVQKREAESPASRRPSMERSGAACTVALREAVRR